MATRSTRRPPATPRQSTSAAKAPASAPPRKKPAPAAAPSAAKPPKAAPKGAATKVHKPGKDKLVRDSFTMPEAEYAVIAGLKQRALKGAHAAKKSEVLRAGVRLLAKLDDAALLAALQAVPSIKTGRPKDERASKASPKKTRRRAKD